MLDYRALLDEAGASGIPFGELLARRWCAEYSIATSWVPQILVIAVGQLSYAFDAAPALSGADGEDRVVGVWGTASRPRGDRDKTRMAGLIPVPRRWSGRQLDRGHFVAHAAGGGTDLNLFPQSRALNRGTSVEGKRWRALERAYGREGTFLFVRPLYADETWVPSVLEAGYVGPDGSLHVDRFPNR